MRQSPQLTRDRNLGKGVDMPVEKAGGAIRWSACRGGGVLRPAHRLNPCDAPLHGTPLRFSIGRAPGAAECRIPGAT